MEVTASWLTLNLAYVLYVLAAIPRKIIPIRAVLIAASVAFIVYGLVAAIYSIVVWNLLFGGAQLVQLIRLLMADRNLKFTAEQRAAWETVFSGLSGRDFLYMWSLGTEQELPAGAQIMTQGTRNQELLLLIEGTVDAWVDDTLVANRAPLTMLGEMSFLTGEAASATIVLATSCRVRCWQQDKLHALETLKPDVYSAMVAGMGRQVSQKLATGLRVTPAAPTSPSAGS